MIEVVLFAAGLASPASLAVKPENIELPAAQHASVDEYSKISQSERMSSISATTSWIHGSGNGIDDWRTWD